MKNIILVLVILITGTSLQAQTKVGTIDADFILQQMPEMVKVEEGMKTYNTELQENLQSTVKQYEELIAAYQTNADTFNEEEKQSKEDEIITLENEIKNFRQKASVLMQMRNNELTQPLYLKIDEAMKAIITEQAYTQILNTSANGLAYADEKYDITDAVIKKLGITVKE
ncbi:OmpH family outer membrane protein [Gillisia limnaea]|uniref:Outer membrane chaperone Skp (OmpH) n=1 Tax=Gillisia limnaea (strain DSM 15749 / LMG 21470 / R-8282) TaxID=865937 RepID=H2C056_GILLR|nr:OmpH family outer membrane protein [Gillisia limnaea]EHQ03472.1 outer membrane chaperone Skp (OmpH) [Gillisia limnaea DSM 15749]